MSTDYYLLNSENKTVFELGKGFRWGDLLDNLGSEKDAQDFVHKALFFGENDMTEEDIEYGLEVVKKICDFIGATPISKLSIIDDVHHMISDYVGFADGSVKGQGYKVTHSRFRIEKGDPVNVAQVFSCGPSKDK